MVRRARRGTGEVKAVENRFQRHEVAIYKLVLKCFNILAIDVDIQWWFSIRGDFVFQGIFGYTLIYF